MLNGLKATLNPMKRTRYAVLGEDALNPGKGAYKKLTR